MRKHSTFSAHCYSNHRFNATATALLLLWSLTGFSHFRLSYFWITFKLLRDHIYLVGHRWRIGRVDAFRPEGHGIESHSSRQLGTLGKSFTYIACSPSACKLRHSVNCCGWERFRKAHAVESAIEMDKYNTIPWWQNEEINKPPCTSLSAL